MWSSNTFFLVMWWRLSRPPGRRQSLDAMNGWNFGVKTDRLRLFNQIKQILGSNHNSYDIRTSLSWLCLQNPGLHIVPHRASTLHLRPRIPSCIDSRVGRNSLCHPSSSGTPEQGDIDRWGDKWSDRPHWSDLRKCWRYLHFSVVLNHIRAICKGNTHRPPSSVSIHVTVNLHKHIYS